MAEDADGSSKTEEATPRKLEEARKRGEVAKSMDVPSWASLTAVCGFLAICGGWMTRNLANALQPFLAHPDAFDLSADGALAMMRQAALASAPLAIGAMAAAAIAGAVGNLIQTGFLFSTERLKPDLSRLSLGSGFTRMFGLDGLIHFLRSLLKIAFVGGVAWYTIRPHATEFQLLAGMSPMGLLPLAADMLKGLFFGVLALMGVGALVDWIWQRQRFLQRMRMTRTEMKEDFRQSEGDPHVRGRLRQIRYDRARRRMIQNVKDATVVVTNPTHFAVALRYVSGETAAPVCLAKGVDEVAFKIREVAEENRIPVVEDPPLARALFATVEIDRVIPRDHYEAVAKVIGFVMQQARRRRGLL